MRLKEVNLLDRQACAPVCIHNGLPRPRKDVSRGLRLSHLLAEQHWRDPVAVALDNRAYQTPLADVALGSEEDDDGAIRDLGTVGDREPPTDVHVSVRTPSLRLVEAHEPVPGLG